jgi:hypothetical protein
MSKNIGVGDSSDIMMRTARDQAMIMQYNQSRENFNYAGANIGVLNLDNISRTPHDIASIGKFGCGYVSNEGFKSKETFGCGYARTTDNTFNPWSQYASYAVMR